MSSPRSVRLLTAPYDLHRSERACSANRPPRVLDTRLLVTAAVATAAVSTTGACFPLPHPSCTYSSSPCPGFVVHARRARPALAAADAQYYRDLALDLIPALLEQELALVVPAEVVGKLSDDPRLPLPGRVTRIDQHPLGWAINELVRTYDIVVEVKNTRPWIYPGDDELHQLESLRPAAGPTRHRDLAEITDELGYRIDSIDDPAPALINHFTTLIPAGAAELATQWRTFGSTFLPLYELLRHDDLERYERNAFRQQLLDAASVIDYGATSRETSDQDDEVPWDHA